MDLQEQAKKISELIAQVNVEDKGNLLVLVGNILKDSGEFSIGNLIRSAGYEYGINPNQLGHPSCDDAHLKTCIIVHSENEQHLKEKIAKLTNRLGSAVECGNGKVLSKVDSLPPNVVNLKPSKPKPLQKDFGKRGKKGKRRKDWDK